jgi:Ca2+-transporting ATPase
MQHNSWHSYSPEKVFALFRTDVEAGLTDEEAKQRLAQYGKNVLDAKGRFEIVHAALSQFKSPLVLVLLTAGIATLLLGEFLDTTVIFIALAINVVIGVAQEGKAARVFEALAASQEKFATVLRDGKKRIISAEDIVVGDVVFLEGGAAVPADIRLLQAVNLSVSEAALTGESVPVAKGEKTLSERVPVSDQNNMAWMGTFVTEGFGVGVVVATGVDTQFGNIAESTDEEFRHRTPLQQSIRHIANFLMLVIGISIVVIISLGLFRGEPFGEMLLVAIAVAVAAMPAGLPAAVTVVLAVGMEAILEKGGLVRNLLAAETLGSTTVVLTDKTGTLTKGRMSLEGFYTASGIAKSDNTIHGDNSELLKMAVLASDAFVESNKDETGKLAVHGRPLEKAIMEVALRSGISQPALFEAGNTRLDFVQFEPTRRYAVSLNEHSEGKAGNKLYFSGSPEHLLELSSKYLKDGKEVSLSSGVRDMFSKIQKELSSEGMRFIAVAFMAEKGKAIPKEVLTPDPKNPKFTFGGLISFTDMVREDVSSAIQEVQNAGARVLMVTGDYPETAKAVAQEVGICKAGAKVITGRDVEQMPDEELLRTLKENSVFARVLPAQKLRIARLLRSNAEVVAMTGDGVNDAPALAAADIGIAVGSGTDVAKSAADLVLLKNSFAVITEAIGEGRRIIANLRKIVAYLLSTGFSEIIIIVGALAAGAPLPILPSQILWANIVEEGLMSFPFAFEPKEKGVMSHKPEKRNVRSIVRSDIRRFIFIVSAVTGALLLALYFTLLAFDLPIKEIRTVMFVALSLDSIFFAFSFKDISRPIWRLPIFSNPYLLWALGGSVLILLAALVFPPLQALLSLTPLNALEVFLLVLLGIANLMTVELAKHLVHNKKASSNMATA